jgi:DNA-binding transcriptional ArsR family regulator
MTALDKTVPSLTASDLDRLLAALADPERRAILRQLGDAPHFCGDILPERPRSSVSMHLKQLREAGLIEQAREGRVIRNSRAEPEDERVATLVRLALEAPAS